MARARRSRAKLPAYIGEVDTLVGDYLEENSDTAPEDNLRAVLDLVNEYLEDVGVWVDLRRSTGARSYHSSGFPATLRAPLADDLAGKRADISATYAAKVGGHHVRAIPLTRGVVNVGLLGIVQEAPFAEHAIELLSRLESRLEPILYAPDEPLEPDAPDESDATELGGDDAPEAQPTATPPAEVDEREETEQAAAAPTATEKQEAKKPTVERHTLRSDVKQALDREGLDGVGDVLALLQTYTGSERAALVYLDGYYDASSLAHTRGVNAVFVADGDVTEPPVRSYLLDEGLGGNLIDYPGEVADSGHAMAALGIVDAPGDSPPHCESVTLEDRTRHPNATIGKLFLIGSDPLDASAADDVDSVAMQIEAKLSHYHSTKRDLSVSLPAEQAEFLIRRPDIAHWVFDSPRQVDIALVQGGIHDFADIVRRVGDPQATIGGARRWVDTMRELSTSHGGYFDDDAGDSATCMFGPPFYEAAAAALDKLDTVADIESFMDAVPPDAGRYAYGAVMFALAAIAAAGDSDLGGEPLAISVGIEVSAVTVGNLSRGAGSLTAIGDGVSHAARLQETASAGQVVIGPNCHEAIEAYRRNSLATDLPFEVASGGNVQLKGVDEPAAYYVVTARA
jgi:class 3 adenylate cyclase